MYVLYENDMCDACLCIGEEGEAEGQRCNSEV